MHILRVFHAHRLLWCLGLLGVLAWSSGCDSGAPVSEIQSERGAEKGKADMEARIKAYGTAGVPKPEMPKKR